MKCRQCGSESSSDARFCSVCGAPLADPTGDTTTMIPVTADDRPSVELTDQEFRFAIGCAEPLAPELVSA